MRRALAAAALVSLSVLQVVSTMPVGTSPPPPELVSSLAAQGIEFGSSGHERARIDDQGIGSARALEIAHLGGARGLDAYLGLLMTRRYGKRIVYAVVSLVRLMPHGTRLRPSDAVPVQHDQRLITFVDALDGAVIARTTLSP